MNKLETYFLCRFVEILGWEDLPFTQVFDELNSFAIEAAMEPEVYDLAYDLYPEELLHKMMQRVLVCDCEDYRTPTYDEVVVAYNNRNQIAQMMSQGESFANIMVCKFIR